MSGVLGAILAGGLSQRFGSDKAYAMACGKPLIEHAIGSVAAITPSVVICGRDWPGYLGLSDRPTAGLGPLSGLAAALEHARNRNIPWVLSVACDTPFVDPAVLIDLVANETSRFVENQPVIGLWPSNAADRLCAFLCAPGGRSVRRWSESIGARPSHAGAQIVNINHGYDLDRWIGQNANRFA